MSTAYADESVIDWDGPPSSPFVSEVADSRAPSKSWDQQAADPEVDAIFEDPASPELPRRGEKPTTYTFKQDGDEDKENTPDESENVTMKFAPVQDVSTPTKRWDASPRKEMHKDADAIAMPPPSLRKRSSPTKSSPLKTLRNAAATPLPRSQDSSFEESEERLGELTARSNRFVDQNTTFADETSVDDTCFSTFSEIPEMTLFAKIGDTRSSPLKQQTMTPRGVGLTTPNALRKQTADSRSPSPTPRRQRSPVKDGNTTSLLLDFTQQIESYSNPAQRARQSPAKSSTQPNLLSYLNNQRTPAKSRASMASPMKSNSLLDLLDFDLPPPSTPRSMPTISVREMESLKSNYLSQLSSLRATLSGREAEVESLKKAVNDAERRVGEAQEAMREEKSAREHADSACAGWEKRGTELENVLKSVKEEVIRSEDEKTSLAQRVEDAERRAEEAEARALELQTKLAAIPKTNADGSVDEAEIQRLVQAQLDLKIETVSRELHAVYKKKHETKVATLKKSYEARSEKKLVEMQARVDQLSAQNEELQAVKEDTFALLPPSKASSDHRLDMEKQKAEIEEQKARLAGYATEMRSLQDSHAVMMRELEKERVEKGDLVAAVEEMLKMQAEVGNVSVAEDLKKSIGVGMGIQRPSRLGMGGGLGMDSGLRAPGSGLRAPGSGIGRPSVGKSKMMSNIERMGGGRSFE